MWCIDCKKDQKLDEIIVCKELGHKFESEQSYTIANKEQTKDNKNSMVKSPVFKVMQIAKSEIIKIIKSQSNNTQVFAIVKINDHCETIELDKNNSKTIYWIRVHAIKKHFEVYSEDTCASAIGLIKANAVMSENTRSESIHLRLAHVKDEIYYDLGRADWKLVKVAKDKISLVDYSADTPMFIRTSKTALQVEPDLNSDRSLLDEFVKLCRVPSPELFKVHLISMFIDGVPMPIMAIHGHAGASKSTTSSMIKRVIDPSGIANEDNLKSFPHGEDNFVTSLSGSYFSAYENISHIDVEISNMLCRAVTGGSFEKRTQYTNGDVYTMSVKRKILINGIDFTISQSDLADRSIIYEFQRIPEEQRKTDKFVEVTFSKLLPDLLGEIFQILQKALSSVDQIEKECKKLPRMASFGIFGEAIYQAMGHKQGEFLTLYNESIQKNLEDLYENNPVIPCLDDLLCGQDECEHQANDLYRRIRNFVDAQGYNSKRIPQASNGLSNWFTRSKTLLDENKIKVTKYNNKQSKEVSGFTPNATIYNIKRIKPKQTNLDNELDV